jgi:hypothetical protein
MHPTIAEVAKRRGLTPKRMLCRCRLPHLVDARREAAALLRARGLSWKQIGRLLQRSHVSVINLLHPKVQGKRKGVA